MISRDNFKLALAVIYTIQILIIAFAAFYSPFIAVNIISFISINAAINFAFSFYLLNLKNVKGWWKKQWYLARARANHKRMVKLQYEKEVGYTSKDLK